VGHSRVRSAARQPGGDLCCIRQRSQVAANAESLEVVVGTVDSHGGSSVVCASDQSSVPAGGVPDSEQNLWKAAGEGDLDGIRRELRSGTPVDSRSECGLTPLHLATLFHRVDAVELLLSERAHVSLADAEGNTALHMAAFLGHTGVVRVLQKHAADPDVRNKLGFTASDLVAITWNPGLEDYYRGVEKTLKTRLDLSAIRAERPKILKLLVATSPETDDSAPTVSLWQAAMTGNTAAVRQHIAAGTNLDAKEDFGGSTPLMLAAIFDQREVASILIDAGANLELKNNSGGTALHVACFFCRPEMVELLLQAGVDSHQTNGHGLTPLGVVTAEFDAELEGAYRHVYESLGLKFDRQSVLATRRQIERIIQDWQAGNIKADSL
jgi:ankyrin repeat protein